MFTGGSLIVGSAARTDLFGADRARELAHAQYRSLQRLSQLPDPTAVWPTHGAGSFCSAPPGAARTSTIGRERAANPLLAQPDEDAFVAALLGALGSYPPYFARLGEINRRGPALLDPAAGQLTPLSVSQVRTLRDGGATVLDVRPVPDYAAGHIPGSVSIPLRNQFATWLGWLVAPDTPVVVLRGPDQDPEEIIWQALKIGYERLVGRARRRHARLGHRRATGRRHRPRLALADPRLSGARRPAGQRVRRRAPPRRAPCRAGCARRGRRPAARRSAPW